VDPTVLEGVAQQALDDYGVALALPAQTDLLIQAARDLAAAEPDPERAAELRGLVERHAERVREKAAAASQARALLYAQERSLLIAARDQVRDARQRYLLEERIGLLDAQIALEAALMGGLGEPVAAAQPLQPAGSFGAARTLDARLGDGGRRQPLR
jgi:hypothetical protein